MKHAPHTMLNMAPYLEGQLPLPNPIVPKGAGLGIMSAIMSASVDAMPSTGRMRDNMGKTHQARYFLQRTQGGQLDGSGWVLWTYYQGGRQLIGFCAFAVCLHDRRSHQGGNPRRGWHPGSCTKCGLDMTVDSSD